MLVELSVFTGEYFNNPLTSRLNFEGKSDRVSIDVISFNNVGKLSEGQRVRIQQSWADMLNPALTTNKEIREFAEDLVRYSYYTSGLALTGLAVMAAGGKISFNPDDPDFLQARFGDKVFDLTGGSAAYVRTFLRLTKAVGYQISQSKERNSYSRFAASSFFRSMVANKLSPNTAYGVDAFFGGRYGQDFDPSDIVKIYPMYADDAVKALKEEGAISLATVLLPNLVGIGYGSYASKGQIDKNLEDLKKRNTRSDEMNSENIKNYKDGGRTITDKEFNEYADKRDAEIEKDLNVLYEKGVGKTPYKDLTTEQVKDETSYIKAHATIKVKKEMFGERKKTDKEKKQDELLQKEREKKYKNN